MLVRKLGATPSSVITNPFRSPAAPLPDLRPIRKCASFRRRTGENCRVGQRKVRVCCGTLRAHSESWVEHAPSLPHVPETSMRVCLAHCGPLKAWKPCYNSVPPNIHSWLPAGDTAVVRVQSWEALVQKVWLYSGLLSPFVCADRTNLTVPCVRSLRSSAQVPEWRRDREICIPTSTACGAWASACHPRAVLFCYWCSSQRASQLAEI